MKTCPICHESFSDDQITCPRDGSPLAFVQVTRTVFSPGVLVDGRYRLEAYLGQGAFSEVWRCHDLHREETLAIKLLKFSSSDIDEIKDSISRFFREADSASRLGHPNIVKICFFGKDPNGQAYLTMEYLEGKDLSRYVVEGGATAQQIRPYVGYMIQVAQGMAAAHKSGILHRDLKPDNIFLDEKLGSDPQSRRVKILDFGVAKILHDENLAEISKDYMFGTPSYMSPEQVKGHNLDGRTDIYSLGIILFELFTGTLPFKGKTAQVLLHHIRTPPPNPLSLNPTLPRPLSALILKAMAKHLDHRFQTMQELVEVLENLLLKL